MITLEYRTSDTFFPEFDAQLSNLRVGDSIQVKGFKDKHQLRQVVSHIFGAGGLGEVACS